MKANSSQYFQETTVMRPMTADQVFAGLSRDEAIVVIRLILILRTRHEKLARQRTASQKDRSLLHLDDLVENFLPLYLEGDPKLPEKLQVWFEKYIGEQKPITSKQPTPIWDEFMSKLRAAKLRRAKRLENFLKSEQVVD